MTNAQIPPPELIRFGTSSFSSKDWVGNFYPAKTAPADFLQHYARTCDTVEIDSTYYSLPAPGTVDRWLSKTPAGFLIAAKFPRSIVHGGKGPTPDSTVMLDPQLTYPERDRFLEVMSRLGPKLGPLILQFPYLSRKVFADSDSFFTRLDRFLSDLPGEFRYGVEIRNRAWLKPPFADLCRRHNAALVLVDQAWMPMADEVAKSFDPVTTDFCYIRLLGDRKEIEAVTTTWDREVIDRGDRLLRWADYLASLLAREIKTLVYVNNHYAGHAPATVAKLRNLYLARTGNPGQKS